MLRIFLKVGVAVACLLVLFVSVPRANAGAVDFACGAPLANACQGTVALAGGVYSGNSLIAASDFDSNSYTVNFAVNAVTGQGGINIQIGGMTLATGMVTKTTLIAFGDDDTLTFQVNWMSISGAIAAALGSSAGYGLTTVEFVKSGPSPWSSTDADARIIAGPLPLPELSTLVLLGTGLLGLGGAFRRSSLTATR